MIESIGERLKVARENRGLSLEQAEQATKIRQAYLNALEAGRLDQLPSQTHARGFLRLYASYLGVELAPPLPAPPAAELPPSTVPEAAPEQPAPQEAEPPAAVIAEEPAKFLPQVESISSEPPEEPKPSQQIFEEIGRQFKAQRDQLHLSLADVEQYTHLREHHLKALEEGRMSELPSLVQARGMLANYAKFLNLDSEKFLLRYAEALQSRRVEMIAPQKATKTRRLINGSPVRQRMISWDMILGGLVIIVMAGIIIFGASTVLTSQRIETPVPTAPNLAELLLASPSPTITPTPGEVIPASTPTLAVVQPVEGGEGTQAVIPVATSSGAAVELSVIVHQRAWVRIIVDDTVAFLGRMVPGQTYSYSADQTIQLRTGNGAALEVVFNQTPLGLLGIQGQGIDITYAPGGPLNPPATITPVPSPIPTATPTPTETPSGAPTSTPPPP